MKHLNTVVAIGALGAIITTVLLGYVSDLTPGLAQVPVIVALTLGGTILVLRLLLHMLKGEFGSDLLAGVSIVTSFLLGEYLAGALVVLMLSGGTALEDYAMRRASSVLDALARRMPSLAHKRRGLAMIDVSADSIVAGDEVVVLPHELCPVDGVVVEGRSSMDESYLTGEPYKISKTPGRF